MPLVSWLLRLIVDGWLLILVVVYGYLHCWLHSYTFYGCGRYRVGDLVDYVVGCLFTVVALCSRWLRCTCTVRFVLCVVLFGLRVYVTYVCYVCWLLR